MTDGRHARYEMEAEVQRVQSAFDGLAALGVSRNREPAGRADHDPSIAEIEAITATLRRMRQVAEDGAETKA